VVLDHDAAICWYKNQCADKYLWQKTLHGGLCLYLALALIFLETALYYALLRLFSKKHNRRPAESPVGFSDLRSGEPLFESRRPTKNAVEIA